MAAAVEPCSLAPPGLSAREGGTAAGTRECRGCGAPDAVPSLEEAAACAAAMEAGLLARVGVAPRLPDLCVEGAPTAGGAIVAESPRPRCACEGADVDTGTKRDPTTVALLESAVPTDAPPWEPAAGGVSADPSPCSGGEAAFILGVAKPGGGSGGEPVGCCRGNEMGRADTATGAPMPGPDVTAENLLPYWPVAADGTAVAATAAAGGPGLGVPDPPALPPLASTEAAGWLDRLADGLGLAAPAPP